MDVCIAVFFTTAAIRLNKMRNEVMTEPDLFLEKSLKKAFPYVIIINIYYISTLFLDMIVKEMNLENKSDSYNTFRHVNLQFVYKTVNFVDAMIFLILFKLVTQKYNEKATFNNMADLLVTPILSR